VKGPFYTDRDNLYLTIDQGGHAIRAMVFDDQCQRLAEAQEDITFDRPQADHVEYDAVALLESIKRTITTAVDKLPHGHINLRAAALATQRSNIVCWDRLSGEPLSPIISWQDLRGAAWLDQFSEHADLIQRITGLFISAHYGAAKFRWCLDRLVKVRQALKNNRLAMGPMASFLIYHLLKERPLLTDPVNASRTLLWDIDRHDWSPRLLRLFDLPATTLPQCVPTRHQYGALNIAGNEIPLTVVTGDQAAALFSHGEPDRKTIYITIGTGAFIQRVIGPQTQFSPALLNSVLIQEGPVTSYTLEGTVNGAGSALAWLEDVYDLRVDFEVLSEWLARESGKLLFINGIAGLGTPFMLPDFESDFVGKGEIWQKVCAVIESIVFLIQLNLENMLTVSPPPERIVMGGGLARLDGLCQRVADLCGLPVFRTEEHETTSCGLAFLLTGCITTKNQPGYNAHFTPDAAPALSGRYQRWKQIMAARVARLA